jgi:hypothetical protein
MELTARFLVEIITYRKELEVNIQGKVKLLPERLLMLKLFKIN